MEQTTEDIRPNHVPQKVDTDGLKRLKLAPREAFLLSQIDGQVTVEELSTVTGMSDDEVHRELKKFIGMGVVHIEGVDSPDRKEVRQPPADRKVPFLTLEDRVRELYTQIESIDYYSLLGVQRDAPIKDIKVAYHKLSKIYHPDRLFRKGSEEVRERLQYVFATINKAYQTLSNTKKRGEYDTSIADMAPAKDFSWVHAEELGKTPTKPEAKPDTIPHKPKLQPEKPKAKAPPEKPKAPPKKPIAPKKPVAPPPPNPFSDTVMKARRIYEGALEEIKRKSYTSAKQNVRIAMTLDQFNKVYPETLRKIEALEAKEQARQYFQIAQEKERENLIDESVRFYREATLLDIENAQYYIKWARILLEKKDNVNQAKTVIQKAFDLGGKGAELYLVMGKVMKELGQRQAALNQFEQGLKIEPKNKELQKALKQTKKGK